VNDYEVRFFQEQRAKAVNAIERKDHRAVAAITGMLWGFLIGKDVENLRIKTQALEAMNLGLRSENLSTLVRELNKVEDAFKVLRATKTESVPKNRNDTHGSALADLLN
jgi:hypothetical protein